jgi:hypothetical protein
MTLTQLICKFKNERDCRITSSGRCLLSADIYGYSGFEEVPWLVFIHTTCCLKIHFTKYVQIKKFRKLLVNVVGRRWWHVGMHEAPGVYHVLRERAGVLGQIRTVWHGYTKAFQVQIVPNSTNNVIHEPDVIINEKRYLETPEILSSSRKCVPESPRVV